MMQTLIQHILEQARKPSVVGGDMQIASEVRLPGDEVTKVNNHLWQWTPPAGFILYELGSRPYDVGDGGEEATETFFLLEGPGGAAGILKLDARSDFGDDFDCLSLAAEGELAEWVYRAIATKAIQN